MCGYNARMMLNFKPALFCLILTAGFFGQDAAPPATPPPKKPADPAAAPGVLTSPNRELTLETILPPEEAVRQALAAFERIELGGDVQKEAAEITRLYNMLVETAKDNPWLFYIRGRSAILSGRVVDGISDLEAFTKTPPGQTDWKTFRILGDVHVQDYPRLAEAKYRQALALNDREPTILLGLSQAVFKSGRKDEGVQLAERALALDGRQHVGYFDNLAAMLRSRGGEGDLYKAVEVVNQAIQVAQKGADQNPLDLLSLRVLAGEYEAALVLLRDVLVAEPKNASAYKAAVDVGANLAEIRHRLSLLEAVALLEVQAMPALEGKFTPELAQSYARLLELVGRVDDACKTYQTLLDNDPAHAEAKAALERLKNAPAAPAPAGEAEGTAAKPGDPGSAEPPKPEATKPG